MIDQAINIKTKPSLNELIQKAVDLPVLPVTAQKVLSLMSDPDVSIEKIKKLISGDPGLATRLLKVANSAFYGGYRDIQNLTQAILRLGLTSVRNIVLATSMKNVYKRFGLTEKLLWEQLIGSAIASSTIARQTRRADPEDAFVGGLLHDVGMVIMNNEYPDEFAKVTEHIYNEAMGFPEAEAQVFDFSHRQVGAIVVKKWGFPENLEQLVKNFDNADYVNKDRAVSNMVTIIALADLLCQKFGIGLRKHVNSEVDFGNLPESLGLNAERLGELSVKVEQNLKQSLEIY